MEWIKCNTWEDIPTGTWLTKIKKDRRPYNVAEVTENQQGQKIIIVGNHFHWDMGELIAYAEFDLFNNQTRYINNG